MPAPTRRQLFNSKQGKISLGLQNAKLADESLGHGRDDEWPSPGPSAVCAKYVPSQLPVSLPPMAAQADIAESLPLGICGVLWLPSPLGKMTENSGSRKRL